jgi:hypothetical protein
MELLSDLAPLDPASLPKLTPAYLALQAQPAWELSGPALADLATGLGARTAEITRLLLDGQPAAAEEALTKLRPQYAVLLLAGRLTGEALARGRAAPPGEVLREIATGGPAPGLWLADHAPDLAAICRYAEEVPVARRLAARDKADAALRYANERADLLLGAMDR